MEKETKKILRIIVRALCILGMIFLIVFASIILTKNSKATAIQSSIESSWNSESESSYTISELMALAGERDSLKAEIQNLSRVFEISSIVTASTTILLLLADFLVLRKDDKNYG